MAEEERVGIYFLNTLPSLPEQAHLHPGRFTAERHHWVQLTCFQLCFCNQAKRQTHFFTLIPSTQVAN